MRKQLTLALMTVTVAAIFSSTAYGATCQGLACPGVLPSESTAHDSQLPKVASAQDLAKVQASGFYAYGTTDARGAEAVAYVVAPGSWATAPDEIKELPLAEHLLPAETTSKWLVIYGPAEMQSGPWAPQVSGVGLRDAGSLGGVVTPAAASDCTSPWFCVFTDSNFGGTKCQWQSTGVWQTMPTSCNLKASSMVNRRSAWSLLKRNSDNRNYCAVPNSQDSSLSNNGFNDNAYETYNSTSTTKLSAWNCTN